MSCPSVLLGVSAKQSTCNCVLYAHISFQSPTFTSLIHDKALLIGSVQVLLLDLATKKKIN